jgi:isopentenyldiphosphate isomerase
MRIPIVNEKDEIIGYKERKDRNIEKIVRATGLWVTDKDGNILLAKRALSRRYAPGL